MVENHADEDTYDVHQRLADGPGQDHGDADGGEHDVPVQEVCGERAERPER